MQPVPRCRLRSYGDVGPSTSMLLLVAFISSNKRRLTKAGPRFCQKVFEESRHFTTPDPVAVCKDHLDYQVVRSFLEWSCQNSRMGSASSLFIYARTWRMAVIQYTRSPVDSTIKMDMKNVGHYVSLDLSTFYSLLTEHFLYSISWIR